ncbi:hypothetical protein BH11PSE9_BH11PSE9_35630 [soil metagenome]
MKNMTRTLAAAAALAALASFAPVASATVLTFDDIGSADFVPANYGGLDWSSSTWLSFENLPADGTPYTPHSGTWVVGADWGSSDADTTIRFSTASHFDGAWFSGYDTSSVSFELYLGNQFVGTSATLATSATSTFLSAGYSGLVDKVVVSSNAHAFYAMDDFTFTAAVPEPETYALMLAGLVAVGAFVRVSARRRA